MLPQFNLVVAAEYVEAFCDALRTVRVGGQPLHFKRSDNGFFSLDFGQANLHDRPDAVTIAGEARPIASLGLETVEIEDRSDTTAYHVPEGILAVYDPASPPADNGSRPEVSVLEVAPALLQITGRRAAGLHGTAQACSPSCSSETTLLGLRITPAQAATLSRFPDAAVTLEAGPMSPLPAARGRAARSGCARTLPRRRCRCTLAAGSCRSRARRPVV